MPKKAKKDGKKSKKVKKIPAKAGAKARVSKDGKVEVILPVDRSRGPYKPRKTEEQKIQERLNQLRSQERKEYSRQVLAPESVSGSYRRGGSIYRSDVSAPSGGFTGIVSSKEDRENKKLKEVNEKLDKLLAKEKKEKEEKEEKKPESEPKPAETELQQVQGEIVRSNIRRGIESRDRRQRQKQAEERAKRDEEKKKLEQSRVRVATRKLREEKTAQEQSRVAEEERQKRIEDERKLKLRRQQNTRDRRLDEREREQRLRESSRELELLSQKEKADAHKRREEAESKRAFSGAKSLYKSKITERNQLVDDIMGGEKEKTITLQAERNIEKEKRELDRRQKALQDEKNRKDKEEAFKLQEKIDRERQAVKEKEREKLKTEAHALKKQDKNIDDLFSELEKAPKKDNVELQVEEIDTDESDFVTDDDEVISPPPRKVKPQLPEREPEVESDEDFVDAQENNEKPTLPPRDADAEEKRKQILRDQELARELLRSNKDRKIKEEQERINKLSKLNEDFIAHKNREDRNKRRREQRQKEDREKLSKSVVDKALSSAILQQSKEEEERDKPPRSKRGRKPAKVTQESIEALVDAGATRQEIEDNDMRLQNIEVIIRGLFTGFGITLPREYRTASNKIRTQIRIDSVRKLRDRGFTIAQIQEFTRLLDELNEEIRLRDKFGNRYQRRRGVVKKEVDRIEEIEKED